MKAVKAGSLLLASLFLLSAMGVEFLLANGSANPSVRDVLASGSVEVVNGTSTTTTNSTSTTTSTVNNTSTTTTTSITSTATTSSTSTTNSTLIPTTTSISCPSSVQWAGGAWGTNFSCLATVVPSDATGEVFFNTNVMNGVSDTSYHYCFLASGSCSDDFGTGEVGLIINFSCANSVCTGNHEPYPITVSATYEGDATHSGSTSLTASIAVLDSPYPQPEYQTNGTIIGVTPDGTDVAVYLQNLGAVQPNGTTPTNLNSPNFYSAQMQGTGDPMVRLCIAKSTAPTTVMEYWAGRWVYSADRTVTNSSVCGEVPVSASASTPIAIGIPMRHGFFGSRWVRPL